MDNTDTIGEVGLSFTCDFSKPGFVGREAALRTARRTSFLYCKWLRDPQRSKFIPKTLMRAAGGLVKRARHQ